MSHIATITSKRQITIPSALFERARLKEGQKVAMRWEEGKIAFEPLVDLVASLAGSVKVPAKFRGMSTDEIIARAKREHFRKRP